MFDRLTYNIAQNPFDTVKAVACAVADKAGELTLFIDPRNRGESSLKIVGTNEGARIRVPAVTLLDLAPRRGPHPHRRHQARRGGRRGPDPGAVPARGAGQRCCRASCSIENGTGQWQIDLPQHLERHGYREISRTRLNLVFERAGAGQAGVITGISSATATPSGPTAQR